VAPPQPDEASYSTNALALFQTYTRASYFAAFGVQAAPWNPALLSKFWFDSTVDVSSPSNLAVYTVADPALPTFDQLSIPAIEAANVNLPGMFVYPPYVIAPTDATKGGDQVNPEWLSLLADATALMTLFGGSDLVDAGDTLLDPLVYPADELRRMWQFTLGGVPLNAGTLLATQNAGGVGAPGQWNLSSSNPVWVPAPAAPTGLDDTRPPRPMPLRALLPNEELVAVPLGLGGAMVVRTDLAAQEAGFTAADRVVLQQIYNLVSQLPS